MSNDFENRFRSSVDEIRFSNDAKERLRKKLSKTEKIAIESEDIPMKKLTFGKVAAVLVACIMITGATAFAASKISIYISSSNSFYDYATIDEIAAEQSRIKGDGDYEMKKLPESFSSGYTFAGGNKVDVRGEDDSHNTVEKWEDISAEYKNEKGDLVDIRMSYNSYDSDDENDATEERVIEGVAVQFNYDEYLFVPDDYKLDEDTKERLKEEKHFQVSYGADEKETLYFSTVSFENDGITYTIDSFDDVDREELFSIAEELISQ